MELSASEKKCFELLVKRHKERPGLIMGYTKLMEELRADVDACKALIGKMKEVNAVTHDYPPGRFVSQEGAYFCISASIDEVWQEFLQQQHKEKGNGA